MRNPIWNKIITAGCALALIVLSVLIIRAMPPDPDPENGVDFQIVTDKLVYAPGSTMQVKFLVTNTGKDPIYLFRSVSNCGSQLGSYSLSVFDHNGQQVAIQRCFSDLFLDKLDVVEELTNPKLGILLEQWDIYGHVADFELPTKKGRYRLKAVLIPPGLLAKQKEILSQKHMRVLQSPCPAPIVTITIK